MNRDEFSVLLRRGIFIYLVVLLFAVPQAALLPLLDRDEPRFAEASREMLQSGNVVVPTFNHEPRYAKPPLIYWKQAGAFAIFGESAFAARLPSLGATAGTAVLLFAWGVLLSGIEAGTIAALAYAFCLQTMQQGRVATADALLIFFTTLTAFAGWNLLRGARPGWNFWGWMLAFGFGGGFLAKGPEAWLPLLPLLFAARVRGLRVICAVLAIFALGLFFVSWWAIPAYLQTNGAYWREGLGHDVGDRMVSSFQGHGAGSLGGYLLSLPLYFLTFWLSALPWSPLLLTHARKFFGSWHTDLTERYLLLNAALYFIVFSLMVTKLPSYTLPAFPFLALVFARRWLAVGLPCALPGKLIGGFGLVMAVITLVAVPLVIMPYANPSPVGELVREAGPALTPGTQFAMVDFQEPNVVWEMRRVTRGYASVLPDNAEAVGFFFRQPGPRAIIITTQAWQRLHLADPGWKLFSAHGWNAAKGSFLDLTLVVKN